MKQQAPTPGHTTRGKLQFLEGDTIGLNLDPSFVARAEVVHTRLTGALA
jgi:hypothetical protein